MLDHQDILINNYAQENNSFSDEIIIARSNPINSRESHHENNVQ
jgi:hypothetical protein